MAIVTWNPVRPVSRMQNDLDRLFGTPFGAIASWTQPASYAPAVDIYETADALVVTAVVPGLKEENLEISLTGDQFTLRGKLEAETQPENEKRAYYLNERRYGTFARTFTLPVLVQADTAQAHLENGVLTITLPKSEAARPKAIKINQPVATAAHPEVESPNGK